MNKHSTMYSELGGRHWIGEMLAFITIVIIFGGLTILYQVANHPFN